MQRAKPKADRGAAVREWLRGRALAHFADADLNERQLELHYPGGRAGFEREHGYSWRTRPPADPAGW